MANEDTFAKYIAEKYYADNGVNTGSSMSGYLNNERRMREEQAANQRAQQQAAEQAYAEAQERRRQEQRRAKEAAAKARAEAKEAAIREAARQKALREVQRLEQEAADAAQRARKAVEAARAAGSKIQLDPQVDAFTPGKAGRPSVSPSTATTADPQQRFLSPPPPAKAGVGPGPFLGLLFTAALTWIVASYSPTFEAYWWPIGFLAVWIIAGKFFNANRQLSRMIIALLIIVVVTVGILAIAYFPG
jgi:hypothetical protein